MNRPKHEHFAALEQLFSIVFRFDDELRIVAASAVALAQMPWLADRPHLTSSNADVMWKPADSGSSKTLERLSKPVAPMSSTAMPPAKA